MDKVSRVNKYKNLRDSLNDGVAIEKNEETLEEKEVEEETKEEDFYSIPSLENIPDMDEEVHFLDSKDDPGVKEAITRVRENSGKGVSYNTRMDILNQIQASALKKVEPSNEDTEIGDKPLEKATIEKAVKEIEEPDSSEKFYHTMSEIMKEEDLVPDEEDEIIIDTKESSHIEAWMAQEEEAEELEPVKPKKKKKKEKAEVAKEQPEEEESSLFVRILGFLVGILLLCLLLLVIYIIRLFFFS